MKSHLIIPDQHAHPQHNNNRALWLGELIADLKPDVVVNIGDGWDMSSMSSYDRGKKSFQGRTYRADIEAGLDFQAKMWDRVKRRKKEMPYSVFCMGNHEQRISRAIEIQPELEGAIGYGDLQLDDYYDETVNYSGSTPGITTLDGVTYAHYFVSGIAARPLGGRHAADSLIVNKHASATCGHSHLADYANTRGLDGRWLHGCFAGCYQDYNNDWAGEVAELWWRGVVYKRNVEAGNYDIQFISLDAIRNEYGHVT